MIKSDIAKLLISSAGLVALSGCSLASMPKGYSPIEKQAVQELSSANYTPRSADERAAILTQDLFAQATFWSREYDLNPADLEAAVNLASTLRRLGNPKQSIEVAQTTRALYPRNVDLMAELSAALIADNNPKDALPIIDAALAQKPNMARLWSLKGAALDQFEQFPEARQHYAKGLSIAPNDPGIIANVGLSYALEGDPKTAEIWLRRAANMPGASASARQNLFLVLGLQNKFDEAEKWARRDLDQQAVANNIFYIQTLRGASAPTRQVQQVATTPPPVTRQVAPTRYQHPQVAQQPQTQLAQRTYGNPSLKPNQISSPATRLTNYGQIDTAKPGVTNVVSARDAALAAARQVNTNPYANTQSRAQTVNQAPQKMASQNVLGRISQSNTSKAEIALRQQQQLAGRAQTQQRAQQHTQPYPYAQTNQPTPPYGATVTYPNTTYPQTAQASSTYAQPQQSPQEQAASQPARQRRR